MGAVLSHRFPNGHEAPIAFFLRTLAPAERNYAQLDKEALALVAGVKHFHTYIYSRPFTLVTDHKPLLGLFVADCPAPQFLRFTRWSVFLTTYDYTLMYVPGKNFAHADTLSRCPEPTLLSDPAPVTSVLLIDDSPFTLTATDITQVSSHDAEISTVLDWILRGWPQGPLGLKWQPDTVCKTELSALGGCLLWGHRVVTPSSF